MTKLYISENEALQCEAQHSFNRQYAKTEYIGPYFTILAILFRVQDV